VSLPPVTKIEVCI